MSSSFNVDAQVTIIISPLSSSILFPTYFRPMCAAIFLASPCGLSLCDCIRSCRWMPAQDNHGILGEGFLVMYRTLAAART